MIDRQLHLTYAFSSSFYCIDHSHFCNHPSEHQRESTYLINKSDDRENNVKIMSTTYNDKFEMLFVLFDFYACNEINISETNKKNLCYK